MPVRKIKKSYRNVTGAVVSRKNQRMIGSESTLERDLYHLLDFDPQVRAFEEQPVRIPYKMNDGRESHYTPDVIIHFAEEDQFVWRFSLFQRFFGLNTPDLPFSVNKSLIIKSKFYRPKAILGEVKYRKDLIENWREYKPKFKAARLFAREREWEFRILTEEEIRSQLLNNIKFIRRYGHYEFDPSKIMMVLDKLAELGSGSFAQLLSALNSDRMAQGELIPIIWHLVFRHEISVDWGQPLTVNSILESNF